MSYEAVSWALDIQGLRAPVKLVLVALAERADARGGHCYPGFSELTRRASTSRRRVDEAIRELEAIGAITVSRSKSETRRKNSNQYQLAVGSAITVPKRAKKGTTLVPLRNQGSSPGGTGTST